MANEVLTKFGASTAFDFDTNNAALDALAVGAMAWSAPVTDASPSVPKVMVHYSIKVCHTAPTAGGTVEFYLSRADDNASEVRDMSDLGTLTDHGTSTTAANIARARSNLQMVGLFVIDATIDIVYTGSFIIDCPGTDWNLVVYNGTSQTLNATANQSKINYRTMCPEVQ